MQQRAERSPEASSLLHRTLFAAALVACCASSGCDRREEQTPKAPPPPPSASTASSIPAVAPRSTGSIANLDLPSLDPPAAVGDDPLASIDGGVVTDANVVVTKNRYRFKKCFEAELDASTEVVGVVTVELTVSEAGEVTAVKKVSSTASDAFAKCVLAVMPQLKFQPHKGGNAPVVVPIGAG